MMLLLLLAQAAHAADPATEATPTAAVDDARARELYENGSILYEEGRYEDAIAAWEEAYRLSGRPLLLFNMANAQERLARYDEAMTLLQRYRAYAPAEERETLDRRIRNLETRIDEARTRAAAVSAAPVATTPAPATEAPPPAERRRVRVLPVVLGGVGVVGIGAGTAFGVSALGARTEAAEGCTTVGDTNWCTDLAADALQRDARSSLWADVSFGVGALGASGAVVTALLPGGQTGLDVGWSPGGARLTWQGRF